MLALNFISSHNKMLLTARQKTATIRLGDVTDAYPENSVVWITYGNKYGPKTKLYSAMIDRTIVKRFSDITTEELKHQNPDLTSVEELIRVFEAIYEKKKIYIDDTVTIIHFSEIIE